MTRGIDAAIQVTGCLLLLLSVSCGDRKTGSPAVPMLLDHDRMLVDAEIRKQDGTWRKARLWVDTGNPDFFMSEALARALGVDLEAARKGSEGTPTALEVPPPAAVRIGGTSLDFEGVKAVVLALAVTGHATLWMAVFADTGVALLVIANGLRLLRRH